MSISEHPLHTHAHYASTGPSASAPGHSWEAVLTKLSAFSKREFEVFRLLGEGASNRSISTVLHIKERTVKAHVAQILAKLSLQSRSQAGIVAFAWAVLRHNHPRLVLPAPPAARPARPQGTFPSGHTEQPQ